MPQEALLPTYLGACSLGATVLEEPLGGTGSSSAMEVHSLDSACLPLPAPGSLMGCWVSPPGVHKMPGYRYTNSCCGVGGREQILNMIHGCHAALLGGWSAAFWEQVGGGSLGATHCLCPTLEQVGTHIPGG